MYGRAWLTLVIALLMFPQIVETIYSPALADIGKSFAVSPDIAAQTLSFYFMGFAAGVWFWGRLCDRLGRRPAFIAGLLTYAGASAAALMVQSFEGLLAARVVAAFGAAVGSVVTQTVFRDRFAGAELAHVFSVAGIALAVSPAVGIFAGGILTEQFGYKGVFAGLLVLALVLFAWCYRGMPETRPKDVKLWPLGDTLCIMARDPKIWLAALLVSFFNVSLFSYYSLAPFVFDRLALAPGSFGYTGAALACGSAVGSLLNKAALKRGVPGARLLIGAALANLVGAVAVLWNDDSWLFVVPMMPVMTAYSIAIPIILSSALTAYGDRRGTAGAWFGLLYYLGTGTGLAFTGWGQNLGWALVSCALLACVTLPMYLRHLRSAIGSMRSEPLPVSLHSSRRRGRGRTQ